MKWLRSIFGGKDGPVRGIDHVAIVVSDMDRALGFYSGILGLSVARDGRPGGGDKKTFLGNKSGVLLALTEDKNRSGAGPVDHIAFMVDDVGAMSERLKGAGIIFTEEKIGPDGKTAAYHFRDPDGLELEICGDSAGEVPQY